MLTSIHITQDDQVNQIIPLQQINQMENNKGKGAPRCSLGFSGALQSFLKLSGVPLLDPSGPQNT